MHPKSPKWLEDIADACRFILDTTADTNPDAYAADRFLRAAVERNFEIAGEALLRLERTDPVTARRIADYRKVIGFRNRLLHGYDAIDNDQVWEIIVHFVPVLLNNVERLLREVGTDEPMVPP